MHFRLIAVLTLCAGACSNSPTSVANSCGSSGSSANINAVSSNNFSPNTATITHGQSVCCQNSSSVLHTVTADNGAFDVNLPTTQIFQFTYSSAGTYTYHCKIHAGMTGTIVAN